MMQLPFISVILPVRNEEKFINACVASIFSQDYPAELIHIFVIADNCTDNTAQVAREAGAVVYERNNKELVGKGYALDFGLKNIDRDFGDEKFEGIFIFDAIVICAHLVKIKSSK